MPAHSPNRFIRSSNGPRRRLAHLVHDLPIGQENDPVRVARRDRVVGDHDDGLAHLVHRAAHEGEHLHARS